jgi:cyclohexa-1,5-dienecarbonyl-CoA hydratase
MTPPIITTSEYGGAVERIRIAQPPLNVLDASTVAAIRAHVATLAERKELKLLVWEGEGDNFSAGASISEHLPGQVEEMLSGFHAMFREIEELSVPTAAIVRGQCLGGGCELALWAGRVVAHPWSLLGQPEVRLAVFAPVASMGLRWRMTGAQATDLLITGRLVKAPEALQLGLVDEVSDDPEAAVLSWYEKRLSAHSAAAVRHAWRAARRPLNRWLREDLPMLEHQYLDELMTHPDPTEGLTAFLEKRTPVWEAS